ncbi:MAG: transcription-repair coupling factor, partial [Oscillospiraceae bacterium]|nr:transcription-repair coupling factor [Oscillospiraceae bacterium]
MKQFARLLENSTPYKSLPGAVLARRSPLLVTGLQNIHKAHYIFSLCRETGVTAHAVTSNEASANKLCEDLNALFGEEVAILLPSRELVFRAVEGASHEYEHARLRAFGRILANDIKVVVSSAEGAVQYTLPPEVFLARTKALKPGEAHDVEKLAALLVSAGYARSDQ